MKDGKTYTLDAIKTAIFYYSKLEPFLQCNRDGRGNYQLFQVYFCADKKTVELENCTSSSFINCNTYVVTTFVLQFIKDDDVQFSNSTVFLSAQKYTWNN
jgi:hypothetical protein